MGAAGCLALPLKAVLVSRYRICDLNANTSAYSRGGIHGPAVPSKQQGFANCALRPVCASGSAVPQPSALFVFLAYCCLSGYKRLLIPPRLPSNRPLFLLPLHHHNFPNYNQELHSQGGSPKCVKSSSSVRYRFKAQHHSVHNNSRLFSALPFSSTFPGRSELHYGFQL